MTKEIKFRGNEKDDALIKQIVERAWPTVKKYYVDQITLKMDIAATHYNGTPLKLMRLLNADDFNFYHDLGGIRASINRKTGKLDNCFVPRFAA